MNKPTCPDCNRALSTMASLLQHRENYCRYRGGKKAKQPAVARQRAVVNVNDGACVWGDECVLQRTRVGGNGRARDFSLTPTVRVVDVEAWLNGEVEALVESKFDLLSEFLVKGRLVLKAWFVKRSPATFEVLRREMFYLSSLSADFIHDFHHWYGRHVAAIIKNLESFNNRDSDLEFDDVEALDIKFNLLTNLSGRAFFKIPDKLKRMNAVVNVETNDCCFLYAMLSILHYSDVNDHRYRKQQYKAWLNEINFGDVDPLNVHIKKDLPKIEKLNNMKINVHVWEKGELQGCVYNDRKALADKTINLLLIVGSEGERHYCGISSLSRLYCHTQTSNNIQHMCERCIRSFNTKETLEERYQ